MVQKTPDLKGRIIAVTRPVEQTEGVGNLIYDMGGFPYFIPAIEIKGLSTPEPVKKFINELNAGIVDYVILMSVNGTKFLFKAAEDLELTNELKKGLAKTFLIAVGPSTADSLTEKHLHVNMVPTKYSAEGMIESFKNRPLSDKIIRIPRTSNATPTLTNKLRELGANVEEIYVYKSDIPVDENLKNDFYQRIIDGKIDAVVFGSGLSVRNIFKMLSEKNSLSKIKEIFKKNITTVAIGPTTADVLVQFGIQVDVMPNNYLFEEALQALAKFWDKP